jgi:hypothetical protein
LVEWADSPTGETYDPTWETAENLDRKSKILWCDCADARLLFVSKQCYLLITPLDNSLCLAFRKFPVPGSSNGPTPSLLNEDKTTDDDTDVLDLTNMELSDSEEMDIERDNYSDSNPDKEESSDEDDSSIDSSTENDITQLRNSDYDKVGTAEIIHNRKCYRVGQSYYGTNKSCIYTISLLDPTNAKANCLNSIPMQDTFACPSGNRDMYITLKGEELVHLSQLREACNTFEKFDLKYEQNGRSFCYYNEDAKHCCDSLEEPTVCECRTFIIHICY